MNAGLCLYDLPPADRDAEIDRIGNDMRKHVHLIRINSFLNSLPAETAQGDEHDEPRNTP